MNVGAISMDADTAEAAFREYSTSVRGRRNDEYAQIRAAYKELKKGRAIIDITQAVRIAGVDERNRPRIAIVQADQPMCWLERFQDGRGSYQHWNPSGSKKRVGRVSLPIGTWSGTQRWNGEGLLKAVAPIVPPRFLPRDSLANYFLIFEPVWRSIPNLDPILCKRINATTFAAVAQWDMTSVELMILQGRLAQ